MSPGLTMTAYATVDYSLELDIAATYSSEVWTKAGVTVDVSTSSTSITLLRTTSLRRRTQTSARHSLTLQNKTIQIIL